MIIRQRRALIRPGTAKHQKGLDRLVTILDAARSVLQDEGYAGLTMRKVARSAGISTGNLNYYYRTKEDLLQDLLDYVINTYLQEFDRLRAVAGRDPERQLRSVLEFWISDLGTPETTVFFPEFWALSNHNPDIAVLVDELYALARQPLVELITKINTGLSRKQAQDIAMYMCATMEGLTVFAGHKKPWASQLNVLKRISIENFLHLIKTTRGSRRVRNTAERD